MINEARRRGIDAAYGCGACSIYDVSCVRVNAPAAEAGAKILVQA